MPGIISSFESSLSANGRSAGSSSPGLTRPLPAAGLECSWLRLHAGAPCEAPYRPASSSEEHGRDQPETTSAARGAREEAGWLSAGVPPLRPLPPLRESRKESSASKLVWLTRAASAVCGARVLPSGRAPGKGM